MLAAGRAGETYNVGAGNELTNLEVVETICALLDEVRPSGSGPHRRLIRFVEDRPGHDRRYALNAGKITRELGWKPLQSIESGLRRTLDWYLDHPRWVEDVTSGAYRG